ncbi:MAG: GNAT family N-acetyltransferase [Erysipelotrichaceae bacterium]|nr:GNAT family N-acetyltransferase [Erysipelotrichaceae bacterium]
MKIRIATQKDLDTLYSFFNEIIDHQVYDEYGAKWTKDVYPSRKDLEEKIVNDRFYMMMDEDRIMAAGCLSFHEDENYADKPWTIRCQDSRIAVLHLFCVHPDYRGKHIAGPFLSYLIEEAREKADAIHLDTIDDNLPAIKLYEKNGFRSIGSYDVYYEDTGDVTVNLLEYNYEKTIS